ncbi:excalibur calcium-binding domain-containing protein [Nocardioides mangrovi]|uniref:Excalibur calcium-binding domain-containing protein n=1 Tax=Nocardioides mangrovi TaxID=2874580 RepID=A0ABS7UCL9_9ACTN|nr:excalibur calcium-binding domain-containing protein [Nocardioides mangrovi]MBZ5738731.1 excalibur calcium-binding domain-containing protein [Nocardioides mangrovi]
MAIADRDCGDFPSQRAAQIFFLNHGGPQSDPHGLDSDGDGIACESNPAPYYYGTSLPGGDKPDPKPQITNVRSTVNLVVNPGKRIAGEPFRIKVSVRPAISRTVVVQRKVNGRWNSFASGVTGRNGKTSGHFTAPKNRVTYRAVLNPVTKANKRYSAATSRARAVIIQRQRVMLDFDDRSVAQGDQVQASVRATPIRPGRTVVLQMRSAGTWHTVRTSRFDHRGRATFNFTPRLGQDAYRAVARSFRGAASAQSGLKTVTVEDRTPPPAPYDLVAVAGDGGVELSWSRALPQDFAHHEVWMRTADTDWSLVSVTGDDNMEVSLLQNGVTYWFTVTSVDTSGNVSEMAEEASATPVAPAPSASLAR